MSLTHSPTGSISRFVGISKDFLVPCAANSAVRSVLMGHQQITLWHLLHTISIFELSAPNSISSKLGLPESQLHSSTHSNYFYLLLFTNPRYNNTGSFYLNYRYDSKVKKITCLRLLTEVYLVNMSSLTC